MSKLPNKRPPRLKVNYVKSQKGVINHDNLIKNYGKKYLQTYLMNIDSDEYEVVKFITDAYKKIKKNADFLDIGCGPGVQHSLAAVPYAKSVYVADFLPDNLAEIRKWKNAKKPLKTWNAFTELTLTMEGKKHSEGEIKKRENLLKKKIKNFSKVDILNKSSFKFKKLFSAVGFFYCAEAAATSKREWQKGITNVASLVAPEGWLFMCSCRNSKYYMVRENGFIHKLPVACVNENDFLRLFPKIGFDMENIQILRKKVGLSENGISEIILIAAQKLK